MRLRSRFDEQLDALNKELVEMGALIEKAIDTLISGRTSIVIAHRLSTIRKANQIIVLDKGELKEKGSHSHLLAAGGFYARLHEMQFEKKKAVLQ